MPRRNLLASRFDREAEEPLGPLANLLDIMLVFACGLIVALLAMSQDLQEHFREDSGQTVEAGRELPELPEGLGEQGQGYKPMGRVYQDPRTGKLILIGEDNDN
ncbi:hypothetical protein CAI21_16315 [Alkalilimnicola ehrlichii]|uniref:DUF2149 domain-containing protein n=1 Tax=Alkalilimnicola ehrlichii TaxID=351052 RepID=A0A3E0WP07_9GAMM|nr:DUF2149 domain-containing protein [Alkalilimnicola ehrlichii]RFA26838.1 hypothetical protein CAI21_16315 [Alkalilimnicola ehrlichii]RFA33933.1 hypothetical protein CAL65_16445 [Alkalilimnicola ehrlichii]